MDKPLLRFILNGYLYKEDIQDLLHEHGLPVSGSKDELVDRLVGVHGLDPSDILSFLRKDELMDLCDELGLAVSGSRQALLRRVEGALYA